MKPRPVIDVSQLPKSVMDHQSPIWWGNFLLLLIESTMFAILVAAYFYYHVVDFTIWPPPQVNRPPPFFHTAPALFLPTINLLLLLLSVAPMFIASRACLKRNVPLVKAGMVLCVLMGVVVAVLRFPEFHSLNFKWNDNAYASTVWTLAGMHLMHIIIATSENLIMTLWVFVKGLDDKHARDIRVGATYWYWVAGLWVLLYGVIYLSPRFL